MSQSDKKNGTPKKTSLGGEGDLMGIIHETKIWLNW